MMKSKIGLKTNEESDENLISELEQVLQASETDMTIFFRLLADVEKEHVSKGLKIISDAFYAPIEIKDHLKQDWENWFMKYGKRLQKETLSNTARKKAMNVVNPKYVLRNYMSQLAIDAANDGDYKLINELFQLLKKPYDEQPANEKWFAKRPDWARNKIGCSMLSCSS